MFSARTTSGKYLDMVKKRLAEVASRQVTPQRAEEMLRRTLQDLGYRPETGFPDARTGAVPPATPGDIRDLSSSRRIQLILDTNVKQARSLGQIAASEDPMQLMMHPAWKLTRTGARKKPRGDWKKRWAEAGARCGWKGAAKKQMVALKTSPIWQAIADGSGGFRDTLGSPYPPFAFGSGLGWVNVGRSEWKRICASEGIPDGLEDVTAKAKELKAAKKAAGASVSAPSAGGVLGGAGGSGVTGGLAGGSVATPAPMVPSTTPIAAFRANFRSRIEADDAIDSALDAAKAAVRGVDAIVDEMAALREEAGKLSGDAPRGEMRKGRDDITRYRKAVGDARADIVALHGRIVNYGGAVGSTPVPKDAREQDGFDAAMQRYGLAARRTQREIAAMAMRAQRFAAAARIVIEKMRKIVPEFKASFVERDAAERAIGELVAALAPAFQKYEAQRRVLSEAERSIREDMAKWPKADFSRVEVALADGRKLVDDSEDALKYGGEKSQERLAAVSGMPAPADETSQAKYDAFMRETAEKARESLAKVQNAANGIETEMRDLVDYARKATADAIDAEKERQCKAVLAKADAERNAMLGTQVADMVKERREAERSLGMKLPKGDPAEKALDLAYKACNSAKTYIRKAYADMETLCEKRDLDGIRLAAVRFGNTIDYCRKKYDALRKAVDGYKAALVAAKGNAARPAAQAPVEAQEPPVALKHDESAFPEKLTKGMMANADDRIGGSTGAKLLTDGMGRKFVMKQTNSNTEGDGRITEGHLRNEAATDAIYRAAGIKVPDCKVYNVDGKPVKLASFVPNATPLGEWMRTASAEQKKAVQKKLARGFLVDAVLANWDVAGQGLDNILIDESGEPWRVDNGSGMGYRARGVAKKPEEWEKSSFPDEWRTLRDKNGDVFGGLTAHDIFSQDVDWDAVVAETPAKDRPVVERRVNEIKEMQRRCRNLDRAGIVEDVASRTLEATYDLSKAGLREFVPKVSVTHGLPNISAFRPGATAGRPIGLSPADDEMQTIVDKLVAAAKSVNHHAQSDGTPNMATVKAALDASKKMPKLKKQGIDTSKWEAIVKELKAVKPSGQTAKVSNVPGYVPQQPRTTAAKHGSVTEWKYDFIARGGDPNATPEYENYEFVDRAGAAQGSDSWDTVDTRGIPYSCIRKIIQYEQTGKNPDPNSGAPNGESYGFTGAQRKRYKEAWAYYTDPKNKAEMERARKAVELSRAFTQIELENAGLENYDPDTGTIILGRTEDKSKVMPHCIGDDGKPVKKGKFGKFAARGNGESTSVAQTVTVHGHELVIQRFPISAISDTYFTHRRTKRGGWERKYLGDSENEFHVDLTQGGECFYAGTVGHGEELKPYYDAFIKAEKKRNNGG